MCQICLAPLAVCKTGQRTSAALQCAVAIKHTEMLEGSGSWSLQVETPDAITAITCYVNHAALQAPVVLM